MAKSKKVDEFTHHLSGETVEIRLEGTTFAATVCGERITSPVAAEVKSKARDLLDHWVEMKWFPVIELEVDEPSTYGGNRSATIKMEFKRFHVSRTNLGTLYEVEWECDEVHRRSQMRTIRTGHHGEKITAGLKLPLAAPLHWNGEKVWVDYSEELWASLNGIAEGIHQMRLLLSDLMKTRKGLAKLAGAGSGVLLLEGGAK